MHTRCRDSLFPRLSTNTSVMNSGTHAPWGRGLRGVGGGDLLRLSPVTSRPRGAPMGLLGYGRQSGQVLLQVLVCCDGDRQTRLCAA